MFADPTKRCQLSHFMNSETCRRDRVCPSYKELWLEQCDETKKLRKQPQERDRVIKEIRQLLAQVLQAGAEAT